MIECDWRNPLCEQKNTAANVDKNGEELLLRINNGKMKLLQMLEDDFFQSLTPNERVKIQPLEVMQHKSRQKNPLSETKVIPGLNRKNERKEKGRTFLNDPC